MVRWSGLLPQNTNTYNWGSIPERNISLRHRVQTVSEDYSASYSKGTGEIFPLELKRLELELHYSPTSSTKFKNALDSTSLYTMRFHIMVHNKPQGQLYFYLHTF